MKRGWAHWSLAAAIALTAAACGSTDEPADEGGGGGNAGENTGTAEGAASEDAGGAKRGGTLRLAMSEDDDTWDGTSYHANQWSILYATCNGLLDYPETTGDEADELVPGVAADLPEVSEDGLTYTYTIRQGLKFSDGKDVTPADVKATYEQTLNPKLQTDAGTSGYFDVIAGMDAYKKGTAKEISGITVEGDKVTFKLSEQYGAFPALTATRFMCIIPAGTRTKPPSLAQLPPPMTGPYMVSEHVPNKSARMTRNPQWENNAKVLGQDKFKNLDNVDEFVFEIGTSPEQALLKLKNNQLDFVPDNSTPSGASVNEVGNDPQYKGRFFSNEDSGISYLWMNVTIPPFNNKNLREAVNYAIDRQAMLKLAGGKYNGQEWSQILSAPLLGDEEKADIFPNNADIAKAKQLVAESGVKTPIATNLYYNTAVPSNAQVASHVKNQLGQLGFNVALKGLDFSVYYDTIQNPKTKAQFGFAAWSQDFPDAITFFQPLLHSSAAGGGSNYGQFKNPQVDKEIARISKLPSGEERNAEFAKLSTQVMQEHVPWAVYRNRKNVSFTSNKLGGFAWHPAKNFYYRLAYVKQ